MLLGLKPNVESRTYRRCSLKSYNLRNDVLIVIRGKGVGGRIARELGMEMYTLLYLKQMTNKDLLYSIGNSAQYYATA